MKKGVTILLITVIAVLVLSSDLIAQRGSITMDGAKDMLTVNSISIPISNLFIMDSISLQGQGRAREFEPSIIHLASFEIELMPGDAINILKTLYAGINGQQLPLLVITKLSDRGLAAAEREFNMVTVEEIDFFELNAASRETAKAKVSIRAHEVLINDNPGNRVTSDPGRFSRMTTGNKFTLVISGLSAEDVLQVGRLKIASSARPSYLRFNLDIPSTRAKPWSDWFNVRGDRQKKDATISLLDATGSQAILSIELSELEIVAISAMSSPGNIARTTIGLRTNQVPIIN